jgi:ATP-binding cassette subfamily B multidrug efflux pump
MFRFFESLIDPFRAHDDTAPPARLFGFYLRYCLQVWPMLTALVAIGLVIALIEATMLSYVGALVDMLRETSPAEVFQRHGGELLKMAFVVVCMRPLAALLHDFVTLQAIGPGLTNLVRWQAHRYLLRQTMSYYANDFAGRIASNVLQTGVSVRDTVVQSVDALWFVVVFVAASLVILGRADPRLVAPLAAWVLGYVGALVVFVPKIRSRSEILAGKRATFTGRIVDSYTNISVVKLFAHTNREDAFAREALTEHTLAYRRQTRAITWLDLSVSLMNSALIVGEAALAIELWRAGAITVGEVAVGAGLAIRAVTMSMWVMWSAIGIFDNVGQVLEGMKTIARPYAFVDKPDATTLAAPKGAISFERVRFHYGRENGVIDDLSFAIAPGEKVALVGRSGAGKSTLVNLLMRLYELEGGRILIDGQDIVEVTQDSLRRQIGMVTQDTALLNRSILDNIRYGRPEASFSAVVEAAKRAHAHDFIVELADGQGRTGYDTTVGERGVKLSGGQRQRVAIARVLIKNAPILVLDEATSALDSEIEAAIQESLDELMRGKTVIAIAHRLSTIARMDRMIVLDRGAIVETGSHAELLAHDGVYAALWRRQSGGFLGPDAP